MGRGSLTMEERPFYKILQSVFGGNESAYGVSIVDKDHEAGTKRGAKSFLVKEKLTDQLWEQHANGVTSIGVLPLRSDNRIIWAAIDIDEYKINLLDLLDKIKNNNLPITLFRSKSGGAHLFVLFNEPIYARKARAAVINMSKIMGFPGVEVFPKQDSITENNPYGNWINIPYYNAEETERYAIDDNGNAVMAKDFANFIAKRKVGKEAVQYFIDLKPEVNQPKEENEPLKGGPPCLNTLLINGFPPNTRNNSLFNFGVYLKKVSPDRWKDAVVKFNEKYIKPNLPTVEVNAIIKSLDVKDYNYKCNDVPISAVCNRARCLTCQYGIRASDELPQFGRLHKLNTDPPVWEISIVDGGTIELTTEELQSPKLFQKRALDQLNIMPPVPKAEDWRMVITGLLTELKIIEVKEDDTPQGRLKDLIYEFLEGRVQAKERKELLSGKPWINDKKHYFSMAMLKEFLDRKRFNEIPSNKITFYLKKIKGIQQKFMNIHGTGRNYWIIPTRQKLKQEENE